jgi:copper homeostasis protein (lipoprotein)
LTWLVIPLSLATGLMAANLAAAATDEVAGTATYRQRIAPRQEVVRNASGDASGQRDEVSAGGGLGVTLPATFTGDLPCADCRGIRYHLNLWPDQAYHLERRWLGKDFSRAEIGRWRFDPARRVLVLNSAGEAPMQFAVLGSGRLRLLDRKGQPIHSSLPYELTAAPEFQWRDVVLPLRGEFTYLADAARATECLTQRSYPVAMEGAYLALERAYLAARSAPGAALLASFEGRIVERPRREGGGREAVVVVDRFINVWPGETCERWRSDAALIGTYWRIVRLGEDVVSAAQGRREPHLLLRAAGARFKATVGCNQLLGSYSVSHATLRFQAVATTRMACPPALGERERRLQEVLAHTSAWLVNGQGLELLDALGVPLALFQAVYFR